MCVHKYFEMKMIKTLMRELLGAIQNRPSFGVQKAIMWTCWKRKRSDGSSETILRTGEKCGERTEREWNASNRKSDSDISDTTFHLYNVHFLFFSIAATRVRERYMIRNRCSTTNCQIKSTEDFFNVTQNPRLGKF